MDQKLLYKKQLDLQRKNEQFNNQQHPLMTKSFSTTTTTAATTTTTTPTTTSTLSSKLPTTASRKNKIMMNQPTTTIRRSNSHELQPKSSTKRLLQKSSSSSSHSKSQQSYILTQDNDEQDRMVAQHYLLRTAFGSDYNTPIKSLLQKGIVVVDVGCGPGTWTMEMSTAFPKSTFIGVDANAFFPQDIKPRNCHFRTCGSLLVGSDAVVSLPFPDNSIDYIYQRDMNWALNFQTYQPLLLELQRILKPGGWIEFVEPVNTLFIMQKIF
jgi:hypothetical protein